MKLADLLPNDPRKGPPTPRAWGQTWDKVGHDPLMTIGGAAGGAGGIIIGFAALATSTALAAPLSLLLLTALGGATVGVGLGTGAAGAALKLREK